MRQNAIAVARQDVRSLGCALFVFFITVTLTPAFAQRQVLSGHVPQAVKDLNLQPIRRVAATNTLYLAIGLPLRDADAAKAFLQKLYDPASPVFHQYLTPEQFAAKLGPTEQDYERVIAFAKASGFQVVTTHPNRLLLDVNAAVGNVEKAFQVRLFEYQHPRQARKFYAPDAEPSVPSGLRIVDVSGLNNYAQPHPNSHIGAATQRSSRPKPNAGSMGGEYIGNDFRAAYVPGSLLTGAGQNVALVQFDGYYPSDITRYETLAGIPAITLTNILLDSFSGVPTTGTLSGNGEVSLDIEMVNSMAPGISKLFLYEGNPSNFIPNDVLSRIADDNAASQISCSWGWSGGPSTSTDNIFIQMASQGQSFFVASGDSDAYPGSTADSASGFATPAESVYVTSVGGTTLSTAGPTNDWVSETVWNWGVEYGSSENGIGSSGGYSAYYAIPTWQQGVSTNNLGSTTGRNFPDVALTADHVFVAYGDGTTNWFGGTSCATPLWAAFTALVNQQGTANGKSPAGFLNPALYAIGTGTSYSACFHDTTTGNNEWSNSPNAYVALTGYDLCTGWGTPTGTNLIDALDGPLTNAYLVLTGSIISGGNGNGVIDADECNLLSLIVQNIGVATAATVNATLSSGTDGVTITQPISSYPNIAPSLFATNTTPFQISTSPSFVCGTPVSLSLVLTYAGGSATNMTALPTCTSCQTRQISGGLSASSPKQTGRLTRNGTVSTCNAAKSCPGYFTTSGSRAYNAYSFTNTSASVVCVTVTLSTSCSGSGSTAIFAESYLGTFNPSSLCSGYLADLGSSPVGSGSFSFSVPANTNFTVVVNAVNTGFYCPSYTLTIAGLPCYVDGGGGCAGITASFSGMPTNGVAPLTVTFTDTSTGNITNRFWSFGDGGTTNVTTNSVVYAYDTAGVYSVTETVTGAGGSSTNTQSNYITVLTPFQAWQIQYFGSTTNQNAAAGADADGTGQNNLFKYVAGLDPTNPSSVFLLTIFTDTNQPADQDLQFLPVVGGRTYTPLFTTDLVDGVWSPLTTYTILTTNNNQTTISDTNALPPQEFYRIQISLP